MFVAVPVGNGLCIVFVYFLRSKTIFLSQYLKSPGPLVTMFISILDTEVWNLVEISKLRHRGLTSLKTGSH